MANEGNYAVLLEDHDKEKDLMSTDGTGGKRQVEQIDRSRCRKGWKLNQKKNDRSSSCFTYSSMLLAIGVIVTLVTLHLWFTFHLQRKVDALQAKVDSLSTFDLEQVRLQLRNLYDQCDECTQLKISLTDKDYFTDQDHDNAAETSSMETDDDDVKTQETLQDDDNSKKDSNEPEETTEDYSSDSEDTTRTKRILKSTNRLKVESRRKRQADLSSHTQDGVPIFDRGYGVVMRNRTEGLRIYQSLLANDGESKVSDTFQTTDSPVPAVHHRQNMWRGRKDKPRHRHHFKPSTTSPLLDDTESRNIAEYDSINVEDLSKTFSATTSPLSRSSISPNVEFRHSRVKVSADGSNAPIAASMDQNPWSPRNNGGNIFSIGAMPHSGGSQQEDRISAATAPAILTKTIASSVSPSASNRARQQPSVFKVTQPALSSRLPSVSTDNADETRDPLPVASPSSPGKRRVNKKQLRDLSHTATAVHLVADTRNTSTANFENQVEMASRNELGLHTSWKVASNDWDSPHKTTPLIKIDGAILTVKQSGLYFIYAQVHYLDDHPTNAYEVFINTEPFLRCVTSTYSESSIPKANTCYTAAATHLREGDKLFLRDIEPLRYSILQPSKTFLGLIRMAPMADFS